MSTLKRYPFSPNWYIRYQHSDGRYRKVSTRTADLDMAKRHQAEHDATQQQAPEPEQQSVTVLLDAYLKDRKGVVASYDSLYYASKPLKEHYGDCQPRHITPLKTKQYIAKRKKAKKKDGTIIKELGTLRSALSYGLKNDWFDKVPYIKRPARPPSRERWLTRDEVKKLLGACKSDHIKLFINLAVKTGARMSAILELTWDRVSFDQEIIFYPLPGENHGKKRRAIVPMSPLLKEQLEQAREAAQTNWVIEHHSKPLKSVRTAFRNALDDSGIDDCTRHDLRHTCATWLMQKGIPTRDIANMLGDTEEMIRRVYGHHSPEFLKNAAHALD